MYDVYYKPKNYCHKCRKTLFIKNDELFIIFREEDKIHYQEFPNISITLEKYDEKTKRKICITTNRFLTRITCFDDSYCIKCFKNQFREEIVKKGLDICHNNYITTIEKEEIEDILSNGNIINKNL